jgi:fermentation-respiration switch protein FrsA (DUF1100 family)
MLSFLSNNFRPKAGMGKYIDHWKEWVKAGKAVSGIRDTVIYSAKWYLIAVAGMMIFQRHLMYFPSVTWRTSPQEVHAEAVTYKTVDGLTLTSWYVPPKGDKPVFVLFHGNAGNIADRAFKLRYFADRGYGFLLAEYRGYGNNPGQPSEEGLYNDGRAAMTWLTMVQKIDLHQIIVYGESIGTGTASEIAVEYKGIKALVLEAPFMSMTAETHDAYPWLGPLNYLTLDRYDSLSKAGYFQAPVIVLQGSRDEVIPVRHGKALYEAAASPVKKYVLIEGGKHMDLAAHGLLQQIQNFVTTLK